MQRDVPSDRTGLLLINLGTPASYEPRDVRPYLRQFLSDPRVLDIPAWKRWLVLNLFILPFRPRQSGEAYEKIWTAEGSPLLIYGRRLQEKVQELVGPRVEVELAMRYGEPSIERGLEELRRKGVDRIVVFSLYPQYSSAANGSCAEEVMRCASAKWNTPYIQFVPPFYEHPAFIEACAEIARPELADIDYERVFFSFHGVPERHVQKSDECGGHCLERESCCDSIVEANRNCYRAQCYATARALADRLAIPEEKRIVCFQSRLGKDPWIQPYTDVLLTEEARRGVKRAVILSPAFVADCLETLEELGIRAVEDFREAGGEELRVVPCVNDSDLWARGLVAIARENSAWLGSA